MSNDFDTKIQQHWRRPSLGLSCVLWPLSLLFASVSGLRRLAYRRGWKKQARLPVPVVVVGNIHVGGVGKTPIVMALVQAFQARGLRVGVISRGYGRRSSATQCVVAGGSAADYGDEPLLIAQSTGVPVAVGSSRYAAGQCLLAAHPDLDLIVTDDGLQHYALARDFEVVVLSAGYGLANTGLLPQGPLREPLSRLAQADALVITQAEQLARIQAQLPPSPPRFLSTLTPGVFYRLDDPKQTATAAQLQGLPLTAVAGIGQPQKFYQTLAGLGLSLSATLSFPDHHVYQASDFIDANAVFVVTEKDAVKLKNIPLLQVWVLPVSATIEPNLAAFVCAELGLKAHRPPAPMSHHPYSE
ncbi:MAG: tetraacyldisaccharide 4'-kinase [Neisseriaceae bacterium]|nr:tetraacyldisaccharide 4'-kinase [Neisseriaceae bacterium]MBP6861261.1 tetraacyldisaccharide 4'-kinase [Neisseriaceae bacterium]